MTDESISQRNVSIKVPVLARVEGEGALELRIENNAITHLKLNIFEPPRLFEKFLEGRHYSEVPDIVARICGICPVAYQMSSVHAFENLFQYEPDPWVKAMRQLFYCGEWIESHALHIHLLAAPDFLGYSSAPAMAKDFPEEVKRGVQVQQLGNDIVKFLGGRSVHPVGVKVGGFHYAPKQKEAHELLKKLEQALPQVEALLPWVASLDAPVVEQIFTNVALYDENSYAFIGNEIALGPAQHIAITDYEKYFAEHHEPHSTALFSLLQGKPYLVGPLARINLNFHRLPDDIQQAILQLGLQFPSQNMYHSIVARAIEVWFAFRESIQILQNYQRTPNASGEVQVRPGIAYGCSEAPRGILWHRYEVDEQGMIVNARIVPPTSQNQARMEEDLIQTLTALGLEQSEDVIRLQAEQIIRNYDPCISCATHFLDLKIHRL